MERDLKNGIQYLMDLHRQLNPSQGIMVYVMTRLLKTIVQSNSIFNVTLFNLAFINIFVHAKGKNN